MLIKKSNAQATTKKYNFTQALYLAWFSGDFYYDVYLNWRKHMLFFLFGICFVICIPMDFKIQKIVNNFAKDEIFFPLKNMPKLLIEDGKLVEPKDKQIFIKDKNGKIAVIIDTKNIIRSLPEKLYPAAFLLLNKNSWSFLISPNEWVPYEGTISSSAKQKYNKNINELINAGEAIDENYLQKALIIIRLSVIPATTSFFFAIFLTFLMFFSLTSKFISVVLFKISISIKQSTRIMIVSSIPTLWTAFFISLFPIENPMASLIAILFMPFYYNFAIFHIKKRLKRQTPSIINPNTYLK